MAVIMHSQLQAKIKVMRFAALAAVISTLAGCAVAVPLRPLPTSPDGLACTASSRCPNATTSRPVAHRPSQPVHGAKIDHDPPLAPVRNETVIYRQAPQPNVDLKSSVHPYSEHVEASDE